jgi:hypothetical protein
MNKSILRWLVPAALAIAALVLSIFALTVANSNESAPKPGTVQIGETKESVSILGSWTADKMTATVTETTIEIQWSTDEMSGLYWKGSFVGTAADGDKLVSAGDLAAMEESFISSRDPEKEFVYENGKLSFKRTVMGMTSVIHLTRS